MLFLQQIWRNFFRLVTNFYRLTNFVKSVNIVNQEIITLIISCANKFRRICHYRYCVHFWRNLGIQERTRRQREETNPLRNKERPETHGDMRKESILKRSETHGECTNVPESKTKRSLWDKGEIFRCFVTGIRLLVGVRTGLARRIPHWFSCSPHSPCARFFPHPHNEKM